LPKYAFYNPKRVQKKQKASVSALAKNVRPAVLQRMEARRRFIERASAAAEKLGRERDLGVVIVEPSGQSTYVGPKPNVYGALAYTPRRPQPKARTLGNRVRSVFGSKPAPLKVPKGQTVSSAEINQRSRKKKKYTAKIGELTDMIRVISSNLRKTNIPRKKREELKIHQKLIDQRISQLRNNFNKPGNSKIINNYGLEPLTLFNRIRTIFSKYLGRKIKPLTEIEVVHNLKELETLLGTTSNAAKQIAIKQAIRRSKRLLRQLRLLRPVGLLTAA
jgi:hypothetical protein